MDNEKKLKTYKVVFISEVFVEAENEDAAVDEAWKDDEKWGSIEQNANVSIVLEVEGH